MRNQPAETWRPITDAHVKQITKEAELVYVNNIAHFILLLNYKPGSPDETTVYQLINPTTGQQVRITARDLRTAEICLETGEIHGTERPELDRLHFARIVILNPANKNGAGEHPAPS